MPTWGTMAVGVVTPDDPEVRIRMSETMDLSPEFLQIAACPACHSKFALDYDAHELVCSSASCGLAFPVRDGIPVLLIDEARRPGEPRS